MLTDYKHIMMIAMIGVMFLWEYYDMTDDMTDIILS